MTQPKIEELERILLSRDFLYDHPDEYREGVQAAFRALRSHRPYPVGAARRPTARREAGWEVARSGL